MEYADALRSAAAARGLRLPPPSHPEPLAQLDYGTERRLKQEALRIFWREHDLPGEPEAVLAAPVPRGYRATTKRRATRRRGRVTLGFPGGGEPRGGLATSILDPPEHLAIYAKLLEELGRPVSAPLAESLNWAIVRGSGRGCALILNLAVFNGPVVRRAKQIGEKLRTASPAVNAAFLYLDPTGSDYYLEARRPEGVLSWKRLFGPEWLEVGVGDRRLRFPPTVFSQVNEAMIPAMTAAAGELLGPLTGRCFLDLYCGYGLFSVALGGDAARVIGVDGEGPAIEAARRNADFAGLGGRARFAAGRITRDFVADRIPVAPGTPEKQLLDPPRQGTADGVPRALAARSPERVVHVFCGTDEIPRELGAWTGAGYRVERAIPLDLFPGSAALETMALLVPARSAG